MQKTINCRGKLVSLDTPKVMGILNLTPDSFFDGGKFDDKTKIFSQVEKMLSEGADFIDIGAMSSRPGASLITVKEELERFRRAEEARSQRRRRPVDVASGAAEPTTPEGVAKGLHTEGYDLYKRGKLDEALEKYQAALEQHGENPELNYHMGLAWTDKGLAGDSAAFDRAVISFQRVISLVPDSKLAKDAQAMIRDIDSAKKTLGE